VIAYDPFPASGSGINYVSFEGLCQKSDVISLHCPLTRDTYHILDKESISSMKQDAVIINTSRGALIDSAALLDALRHRRIKGAALDVYEEETDLFFEDYSEEIISDDILTILLSMPNVLITSHQAFLTDEALKNIAETTMENLKEYFGGGPLKNEVCYYCQAESACAKDHSKRCF